MICTHCGKEIPDDSLFCGYCGEKVQESSDTDDISAQTEDDVFQPVRPAELKEEETVSDDTEILSISVQDHENISDSEEKNVDETQEVSESTAADQPEEKQDSSESANAEEPGEVSTQAEVEDSSTQEKPDEEESSEKQEEQPEEPVTSEKDDEMDGMIDAEFMEKEKQTNETGRNKGLKKAKIRKKQTVHFRDFKVLWRMLKNPYEETVAGTPATIAGFVLLLLSCSLFTASFSYGILMAIALSGFTFLSCYLNGPEEFQASAGFSKTLRILMMPMVLLFIAAAFYGTFRASFIAGFENYLTTFSLSGIHVEAFAIATILFSAAIAVLAVHMAGINQHVHSLPLMILITLCLSISFFCIYKGGMQTMLKVVMNLISQVLTALLAA